MHQRSVENIARHCEAMYQLCFSIRFSTEVMNYYISLRSPLIDLIHIGENFY
jgi:hypothetical protein